LRGLIAILRKFVGQHDDGIADGEFRVANLAVRHRQAAALLSAEGALVKLDRLRRVLHGQIGCDGMETVRNGFRFCCHRSGNMAASSGKATVDLAGVKIMAPVQKGLFLRDNFVLQVQHKPVLRRWERKLRCSAAKVHSAGGSKYRARSGLRLFALVRANWPLHAVVRIAGCGRHANSPRPDTGAESARRDQAAELPTAPRLQGIERNASQVGYGSFSFIRCEGVPTLTTRGVARSLSPFAAPRRKTNSVCLWHVGRQSGKSLGFD
jgi:hypothetical protein